MTYQTETRGAYLSPEKARDYHRQQSRGISWARMATWHQKRQIRLMLNQLSLRTRARILDVPCGGGVLAPIFREFEAEVFAADISPTMLAFAKDAYDGGSRLITQSDVTEMPFRTAMFDCAVVIGFMHRVPSEIRLATLREISRVTSGSVIMSFSVDSWWQRLKHGLVNRVMRNHVPAPHRTALPVIIDELHRSGLRVRRQRLIMFGLSTDRLFLLERVPDSSRV